MDTRSKAPSTWDALDWFWLSAILAIAAGLRLPTLGTWSFWIDEAFTIHDALLVRGGGWNARPFPAGYWLVGTVMNLWGDVNEVSARIGPCVAGLLSIALIYFAARQYASRGVAILAALFMALSAWHLYWSQNARYYTLLMVTTSLVALVGLEASRQRSIVLGLVTLAVLYLAWEVHPTGLLIGPAVFLVALVELGPFVLRLSRGKRNVILVMAGALTVVVGVTGCFVLYRMIHQRPSNSLFSFIAEIVHYVGIPVLLIAIPGILFAVRENKSWGALVTAWAFVPIAIMALASLVADASALYVFSALPALCLLAAHGCIGFVRMRRGSALAATVLASVILVFEVGQTFLYFQYRHGDRPRWREAAEFIKTQPNLYGNHVVTNMGPVLAYYLGEDPGHLRDSREVVWLGQNSEEALVRVMENDEPQWLLILDSQVPAWDRDWTFRNWLAEHAVVVKEFPAWTDVKDRTIKVYFAIPTAAPVQQLLDGSQA